MAEKTVEVRKPLGSWDRLGGRNTILKCEREENSYIVMNFFVRDGQLIVPSSDSQCGGMDGFRKMNYSAIIRLLVCPAFLGFVISRRPSCSHRSGSGERDGCVEKQSRGFPAMITLCFCGRLNNRVNY